jgi:beta-galactosidase
VGFRQIEIRGAALLINGVPVKLAGACHHEIDPLTGRADTMRHAEEDVKLLKAANLNYIRTSHYPPTMELVEAADRYGMYLEVEAPFCWVGAEDDLTHLREVLVPTSAMIDRYHSHPSVVLWSLANESQFNRSFEISHAMVEQLDATRPTTFNNPDPKRICEVANLHYPPMPYDELLPGDPRPLLLGEYYFPVCHEQTDVQIDPGLREFFGFGHTDPDSPWGRRCAESFTKPFLKPCVPPGTWSYVVRSRRVLGGAIWAAFDEPFYFADGTHAGYAWHHGFWGILDAWRRPKPEWWLAKHVFSPVWFPVREAAYTPGQGTVRLPVENRYSFTDLSEMTFTWKLGQAEGDVNVRVPPRCRGEIEIPIPPQTAPGDTMLLTVTDAHGELIDNLTIQLGPKEQAPLPGPRAGAPKSREEGDAVIIQGNGFSLVFDKATGDFRAADPRHRASVVRFPMPHVTRYDFGDLAGPHGKPYAVFPDAKTRVVDEATVTARPEGIELGVRDHYDGFAGTMSWVIDDRGIGKVTYRYTYSGEAMDTREAGVRFVLKPECDEVRWRRWSEWGVFPPDSISRTEGRAKSLRAGTRGADPEGVRPTWPWSQDQTELGTADFRSIKFNVYDAALVAEDGSGLEIHARADRHVRPCLAENAVLLHVLTRCELGQVVLNHGNELAGDCVVDLVPR